MIRQSIGRSGKAGFTLIELLVVIAIIAVLIALLLARRAGGARSRPPCPVHQQPEADRPGAAQLRKLPTALSARRQGDQLPDLAAVGHLSRHRLQHPGPPAHEHRRGLAVQRLELQLRVQRRERRQLHRHLGGGQHLPLPVGGTFRRELFRDTAFADPNGSAYEKAQSSGYGYTDYAPSVYTDINIVNGFP